MGHFIATGDTIIDVLVEADLKFLRGSRKGHKCIPGFYPIFAPRAKADITLANPLAGAQFRRIVIQWDLGMFVELSSPESFRGLLERLVLMRLLLAQIILANPIASEPERHHRPCVYDNQITLNLLEFIPHGDKMSSSQDTP